MRVNVTLEFGNLDVEASTLSPVNTVRNLGISFDPEVSFKKQMDTVVKNCNFQWNNNTLVVLASNRETNQFLRHPLFKNPTVSSQDKAPLQERCMTKIQ